MGCFLKKKKNEDGTLFNLGSRRGRVELSAISGTNGTLWKSGRGTSSWSQFCSKTPLIFLKTLKGPFFVPTLGKSSTLPYLFAGDDLWRQIERYSKSLNFSFLRAQRGRVLERLTDGKRESVFPWTMYRYIKSCLALSVCG